MNPHGPPCPPPNYTVSPNVCASANNSSFVRRVRVCDQCQMLKCVSTSMLQNPPLPRHQQYEMGPPPPANVYNEPYMAADPYSTCMPPPAAHHARLHVSRPLPLCHLENTLTNSPEWIVVIFRWVTGIWCT